MTTLLQMHHNGLPRVPVVCSISCCTILNYRTNMLLEAHLFNSGTINHSNELVNISKAAGVSWTLYLKRVCELVHCYRIYTLGINPLFLFVFGFIYLYFIFRIVWNQVFAFFLEICCKYLILTHHIGVNFIFLYSFLFLSYLYHDKRCTK